MTLTVGNVTATVVVTAASPVVDVTSAVVAEDITLDLTEAVPNIRDTVFNGGLYTSLAGSLSGLTARAFGLHRSAACPDSRPAG